MERVATASSHTDAISQIVESYGGSITVRQLEAAYRSRYSINIPYFECGYSNTREFLTAQGLKVTLVNDEYHVSTVASTEAQDLIENDVDALCVSVTDGLIFGYGSNYDRRKVSIQSERSKQSSYREQLVRTRSESLLSATTTSNESRRREHTRSFSPESLMLSLHERGGTCNYHQSGPREASLLSIYSYPCRSDDAFHTNDYSVCYDEYAAPEFMPAEASSSNGFHKLSANLDHLPDIMQTFGGHSYSSPATLDSVIDADLIPDVSCYRFDTNTVTDTIPDLLNYRFESDLTAAKSLDVISDLCRVRSPSKQLIEPDTNKKYQRRLEQIVDAQKQGIWTDEIETLYYQCYAELLPKNWLETLRKSNRFYIENLEKITVVYPSRKLHSTPTVTSLPQLNYPEHVPWKIHVTVVSSSTSIWFRICEVDFNFRFVNLQDELQKHYNYETPSAKRAKILKCDELYAARYENEMFRVQVVEGQREWAKCFLIDVGSVKQFRMDELMVLHEKFTNTPALAVQGALTDLERYNTCEYVSSKLRARIEGENGSAVVDYIHKDNRVFFNFFVTGCMRTQSARVNINSTVLEEICKELTGPKLETGQTYQVRVLRIDKEKARVQIQSPCLQLLEKSLAEANEIIEAAADDDLYLKSMRDLILNNEVYLAKLKNSWQRVSLKQIFDSTRVAALFIDLGEVEMLHFANIVKPMYPRFSDTLSIIPAQAIEINITIADPITSSIVQHSRKTEIGIFYGCIRIIETKPQLYAQIYVDLSKGYPYKYASYV